MSYMNQADFACATGIQELSFGEIEMIAGADLAGDIRDTAIWVGAGAAFVGAGAAIAAGPTVGATAPVAAGAALVVGAAAVIGGVASLLSDD